MAEKLSQRVYNIIEDLYQLRIEVEAYKAQVRAKIVLGDYIDWATSALTKLETELTTLEAIHGNARSKTRKE